VIAAPIAPTSKMSDERGETYVLGYAGVRQKAPAASGVYAIHSSSRWIYIGESDDIRGSLFQHLNDAAACMKRFGPLSFSFELGNKVERVALCDALVAARSPVCNEAGAQ